MKHPSQSRQLRWTAFCALFVLGLAWALLRPRHPDQAMVLVFGVQFVLSAMVGGVLTGWRATQLPKTRASEFYLVTPVSDWEIVGGELLSGMIRTAYVLGAAGPLVGMLWGFGWIDGAQAFAIVCIPCFFGWAVGIGITVVAYEPIWIRRICEMLVLFLILVYLIAFGLAISLVLPLANMTVGYLFGTDLRGALTAISPSQLLSTRDLDETLALARYVAAICGVLLLFCALGAWRLAVRLRPHYLEELFGEQRPKKDYNRAIGDNPLAWWTARRVSRFRGHVNLYVGWTTILLYSIWLVLYPWGLWPAGFGMELMIVFTYLGGAVMLGISAIHFGLVPAAFMSGLWDSSVQQRIGRLELLLATPLEPRAYLGGCIAAAWTRAKGYFPAALVVWLCGAISGRITWPSLAGILLLGAAYVLLYFAIAFRFFSRVAGDRAAATLGMAMSVGTPFLAYGLLAVRWGYASAVMPLSAMYLLGLPPDVLAQQYALDRQTLWLLVGGSATFYLLFSWWLIYDALTKFDVEIREWFGHNLVPEGVRSKPVKPNDLDPDAMAAEGLDLKGA